MNQHRIFTNRQKQQADFASVTTGRTETEVSSREFPALRSRAPSFCWLLFPRFLLPPPSTAEDMGTKSL